MFIYQKVNPIKSPLNQHVSSIPTRQNSRPKRSKGPSCSSLRASGQGPTWTAAAVVAAAPWSPAQLDRSSVATYY